MGKKVQLFVFCLLFGGFLFNHIRIVTVERRVARMEVNISALRDELYSHDRRAAGWAVQIHEGLYEINTVLGKIMREHGID